MALAIVLVLLIAGSVLFHFLSPWYFTPIASNWGTIDDTITITFWVTGFVFVTVNLFMAFCVIRYRQRKGSRAKYEPENKKLEWWLTAFTAVSLPCWPRACLCGRISSSPQTRRRLRLSASSGTGAIASQARTASWGSSTRYISNENPFGLNPDDPNGQDDVLVSSPDVHLPVNKPVKALLRSIDVLHNFTVPQFRAR